MQRLWWTCSQAAEVKQDTTGAFVEETVVSYALLEQTCQI